MGVLWPITLGTFDVPSTSAHAEQILAPTWDSGDWWRLRLTLDDETPKGTSTVVLGVVKDATGKYHFGLQTWDPRILFAPLVPLGTLQPGGLQFEVYGRPFKAIEFPIQAGRSWNTNLGDDPVSARVVSVQDGLARIDYTLVHGANEVLGISASFSAVWDDDLGFFQEIIHPNGIEVVTLARGYDGPCTLQSVDKTKNLSPRRFENRSEESHGGHTRFEIPAGFQQLSVLLSFEGVERAGDTVSAWVTTTDDRFEPLQLDAVAWLVGKSRPFYSVERSPSRIDGPRYGTFVHEFSDSIGEDERSWVFGARGGLENTWRGQIIAMTDPGPIEPAGDHCLIRGHSVKAGQIESTGESSDLRWKLVAAGVGLGLLALRPGGSLWALLARIAGDRVLDHPTRRRIVEAVKQDPGITTQEIRKLLEIPWTTAVHHLKMLEVNEVLVCSRHGHQCHWFDREQGALSRDRLALGALRSPATRRVYECVAKNPELPLTALAKILGVEHTTVKFHLRRLQRISIVEARRHGRRFRYVILPPVYV